MEEQLRRDALEYHRVPTFGKISVTPTKSLVNQRDLALAYSPGVAYACPPMPRNLFRMLSLEWTMHYSK
jgi:malate dehydrogenase (oxaloacetate-decarboxylating)(NADP+)